MPKFDASGWDAQILHAKDFLDAPPITNYLVKPILVLPSLNVFYGAPSSMKTNLVIDLAVCVALKNDWLDAGNLFRGYPTVTTPILWVDCDSGKNILHERFAAFLNGYAKTRTQADKAQVYCLSFPNPAFCATNDAAVNALVALALKLKTQFIAFDNLGTVSGGADENSSEMVAVMNNLRFISEKTNAAVCVIHHIAKNVVKGNGQHFTPRGHSSIEAAVDLALLVEKDGEAVTVTPTKTRRNTFEPFTALFDFEHYPKTETLRTARFLGTEFIPDPIALKIRKLIEDFLKEKKTANQQQLLTLLHEKKITRPRALSELRRLTRTNVLHIKPGQGHNQTIFTLTEKKSK